MRYFDETTKELIEKPDTDKGKVSSTEENVCSATYVVDKEQVSHEEVVQEFPETGGKEVKIVIDSAEVGHWDWTTEQVYGVPEDIEQPSELTDKRSTPVFVEQVSLWHTYTQEELEEIEKQKKEQEKAQEYSANYSSSTDKCNCVMYESLKETTKFTDTEPFCYAYANRIKKGEILLEQCPEELRDKITEILDGETPIEEKCSLAHSVYGCYLKGYEEECNRGETLYFDVVPEDGFRLPTSEELSENASINAIDTDKEVIQDFFSKYFNYSESGSCSIAVPDNCLLIDIKFSCVEEK